MSYLSDVARTCEMYWGSVSYEKLSMAFKALEKGHDEAPIDEYLKHSTRKLACDFCFESSRP